MLQKIVSLTNKFVSIKSTPENTKALESILELALSNVKEFTIERFEKNGVKSALIYNQSRRPEKFKIILNGHLDIIPGKDHQYLPHIKENKLYGVGSMDMKASIASFIEIFKEVATKINYPLGLQFVTDEEVGGFNGTKHQIDKGVRADFIIAGEATNLQIENKAKGIIWVKISSTGKTAHGAYPWMGENAILKMNKYIQSLMEVYPSPEQKKWVTTVNVSNIETNNKAFNKIPDYCQAWFDIRYVPEDDVKVLDTVRKLLPAGFTIDIRIKEPALSTDEKNPYLQTLKTKIEQHTGKNVSILSANGSSDVRHYSRVECPGVEFGPVGGGMGSDNEWVDISSLETYTKILRDYLLAI